MPSARAVARTDGAPHVLLMTATIAPKADTFLLRHSDPGQRRDDYRRALRFYMGALAAGAFDRIVFAENSGSDLTDLADMAAAAGLAERVSFVSDAGGPGGDLGRCYLEFDLLKKAFACDPIASLPDQAMIWKVTGRYIVRNIVRLVEGAPLSDVYAHSRDYPIRWTDLYLIAFRKHLFARLFGDEIERYNNIRSGEEIFREYLDGVGDDLIVERRFRQVPHVEGTRGFDKGRYDGARHTLRRYLRIAANRVAPALWI